MTGCTLSKAADGTELGRSDTWKVSADRPGQAGWVTKASRLSSEKVKCQVLCSRQEGPGGAG